MATAALRHTDQAQPADDQGPVGRFGAGLASSVISPVTTALLPRIERRVAEPGAERAAIAIVEQNRAVLAQAVTKE